MSDNDIRVLLEAEAILRDLGYNETANTVLRIAEAGE